jgi:hypothetical protein
MHGAAVPASLSPSALFVPDSHAVLYRSARWAYLSSLLVVVPQKWRDVFADLEDTARNKRGQNLRARWTRHLMNSDAGKAAVAKAALAHHAAWKRKTCSMQETKSVHVLMHEYTFGFMHAASLKSARAQSSAASSKTF